MVDRVSEELWTEVHNTIQKAVTKTIPKKTKCKKETWFPEETLQTAKKRSKRQRRNGKTFPTEYRIPGNSKER